METEQCQVCETHEIFNKLVAIGIEPNFAFHIAVEQLVADFIEEVAVEAYDAGHKVGYKEATADVAEIIGAYAKTVEDEE